MTSSTTSTIVPSVSVLVPTTPQSTSLSVEFLVQGAIVLPLSTLSMNILVSFAPDGKTNETLDALGDELFDQKLFVDVQKTLICSLCQRVFRDPVYTCCGCHFCRLCLEDRLQSTICPFAFCVDR